MYMWRYLWRRIDNLTTYRVCTGRVGMKQNVETPSCRLAVKGALADEQGEPQHQGEER